MYHERFCRRCRIYSCFTHTGRHVKMHQKPRPSPAPPCPQPCGPDCYLTASTSTPDAEVPEGPEPSGAREGEAGVREEVAEQKKKRRRVEAAQSSAVVSVSKTGEWAYLGWGDVGFRVEDYTWCVGAEEGLELQGKR